MKPTRPCLVKVGDEVTPTNPEYMTDCIGTVVYIYWMQLCKRWNIRVKLHKPFVGGKILPYSLKHIHLSDTELKIVPKRIGEIVNNA